MIKFSKIFFVIFAIFFASVFYSCANQQPPSGGEDDKSPPKIIKMEPANNTIRFTGNSVKFYFDEYVNRRSFEDAFRVSPAPKGRPKFDWGAKDVEVIFDEGFDKGKTYSIVITKDFRDVNGGNQLTSPFVYAFSTGDKIDKGSISGKIYANSYARLLVSCYIINSQNENFLKPDTLKPDYISQPDETGNYTLSNLPPGTYRLYAFNDDDRNNLYNKDVEKISLLSSDITILDSSKLTENNFLFKNFDLDLKSKEFFQSLKSDSLNIIYSSVQNNALALPLDARYYFYFKNLKVNKYQVADNLKLVDSVSNANIKLVFNWINDSLLQVFTSENLNPGRKYEFDLKISSASFKRTFKTAAEGQMGNILGSVAVKDSLNFSGQINILLIKKQNSLLRYSLSLSKAGAFKFENITEGDYTLFAFIDKNNSGKYDYGKYFPFEPSEPFFLYDKDLKVKGMWNTDNIQIRF